MTVEPIKGPFYHGTIADLRLGDFLTAGRRSNYRPDVMMNHIYFTAAMVDGTGLAADIAATCGERRRATCLSLANRASVQAEGGMTLLG